MPSLPTGTVTFLFTDIEGSTALLQRLGDRRYAEVLAEHQRLLREAFAGGNGQEIDTEGDAFLVVFPRARDAVATAVAAQKAVTRHLWSDGASLRVRMGLHTGEPLVGGTVYVGIDVHRAARIAAAGHGGQILLSDVTHGLIARDLPDGVTLRDLGEHRLKDLSHPHRLFQVVAPDLPTDFPPLRSLGTHPNNLPIQLTSFIGRAREVAEVKKLLSMNRLVTLTGSGGVGKTRLGLQAATETLEEFSEGVWLAELAALSDPDVVPQSVASALGVTDQPGRSLTETLVDALRLKSILVIFDNCEHLVAACAHLADTLLQTCPNLRILATSREALGVKGEMTWPVPSLSVPDPERLPPLDRFKEYEAVRLFVDRALASTPHFALSSNNALAVAQVCYRLDGIPLAIELAAARLKVLEVDQIVVRLDDRFRLLTGGGRTVLPRYRTLRAAIDWSYDLLSKWERVLLHRLSVFAGGWPLEAAEVICSGGEITRDAVFDLLAQLVDKSLVLFETDGKPARYRLLETIRQYAVEKLLTSTEASSVQKRHRDWYLELAERGEQELQSREQVSWLDRLAREHDNFRAALEFCKAEDVDEGMRLAAALREFWYVRGYWREGRNWLESLLSLGGGTSVRVRAKALYQAGMLQDYSAEGYQRRTRLLTESLDLYSHLDDKRGIAYAKRALGHTAFLQGDHERAVSCVGESLPLFRELGDKWGLANGLNTLGHVSLFGQRNLSQATDYFSECLSLRRELGDKLAIASALECLGGVIRRTGDHARATSLFKESLVLARELGDKRVTGECLSGIADTASATGELVRAGLLYGAAEALRESLGFKGLSDDHEDEVANVQSKLGEVGFAAARAEGRAMTLEQAIEYALAADTRPEEGHGSSSNVAPK